MLRAFLERRRVEKTLGRFISPAAARQAVSGAIDTPPLAERAVEFAFIRLSAADAQSYSDRAGAVADAAFRHGGVVQCLVPLVIVGFGLLDQFGAGDRLGFVAELQDVAVVHGRVAATVGLYGGTSRSEFAFWWPGMSEALRQLDHLPAGDTHEIVEHQRI